MKKEGRSCMSGLLKEDVAIVTGSSRGIGRSTALAFAEQGANLVIHGTQIEALEEVCAEIRALGSRCEYVAGDIGEYATAERLAKTAMETYGKIDVLVNNAGVNSRHSFQEITPTEWDRMLQINLTSAFYTCKCVVPFMMQRKSGKIINMSSSAGKTAHPNASVCYGVSKAGINYRSSSTSASAI